MTGLLIVDRMLLGGIRFVLGKIAAAVDAELDDGDRLREELLAAQMRLELGELTEDEFRAVEAGLLARLREARERNGAAGTGKPTRAANVATKTIATP